MSAPPRFAPSSDAALWFSTTERALGGGALAAALLSTLSAMIGEDGAYGGFLVLVLGLALAAAFKLIAWPDGLTRTMLDAALGFAAALLAFGLLLSLSAGGVGAAFWLGVLALWLSAWLLVERIASASPKPGRAARILTPALFGVTLLLIWELVTRGAEVPTVLLPPPSMIGARIAGSLDVLWADFTQTFLKAVLAGYAIGCGAGFLAALAIDRSPFLKRGLLPIGNLVAALPIIGVAPIMVMWFGFDWHSKAAVVVVMTFFPMLVNTVAGLDAAERSQRDLMRTYAASYGQTLLKLRLPAAAPFIFNALKINSTLALIGAIVAEFFGTPIVGMGFRISTEVGRMNLDMVWAEIAVAALAGVAFYGAVSLIERAATFWHPSMRK